MATVTEAARPGSLGGSYRFEREGWIYCHVVGSPRDRGFQHGYLLADEIRAALRSIRYLIRMDTGVDFAFFAQNARAMYEPMLGGDFGGRLADGSGAAVLAEIEGIVAGANANRPGDAPEVTLDDLLGWNAFPELICQWWPGVLSGQVRPAVPLSVSTAASPTPAPPPRHATLPRHHFVPHHSCSAFVATGDYTADGGIVIAQTTWQRFANGDAYNVILDVEPDSGHHLLMQSVPGYVASSTDFWVTGAGLAIVETSLPANGFDPAGLPEFFRARRAAQWADSIASWCDLFRLGNNGGYVNTWLLADSGTVEVAAFELTLKRDALQPAVRSGYYASCNIALDPAVRNLDCAVPSGFDNVALSGGRRVRFEQLMAEHKGKIDAGKAQAILADHRDVYLGEDRPSSRTICGHFDVDDGRYDAAGSQGPFYPWGSLDGKVTTAEMAKRIAMSARWGRACGGKLEAETFYRAHPQYDWLRGYMADRPTHPWVEFQGDRGPATSPAGRQPQAAEGRDTA